MTFQKCVLGAAIFVLAACGGAPAPDAKAPSTNAGETPSASTPETKGDAKPAAGTSGGEQLGELETKRMQENIKGDLAKHKAKFKELCGTDVELDIDWASFGHDKVALEQLWSNYGVERLVAAFEGVCKDKAGKDAVKAKVKKIRAVNIKDKAKVKAAISGGAFTAELTWGDGTLGMNENELGAAITKGL